MIKKLFLFTIITAVVSAQYVPMGSVAEVDDAGAVAVNPAGLAVQRNFNSRLLFPVDYTNPDSQLTDFSWLIHSGTSGFGYSYKKKGYDLFHLGGGTDLDFGLYLGTMAHLSKRGIEAYDMGLIWRGADWLSLGGYWGNIYSREKNDSPLQWGVALRPLGNRFTLSYDQRYLQTATETNIQRGLVGISLEILDGIDLRSNYDLESSGWQVGIQLTYGLGGIEHQAGFDENGAVTSNSLIGISANLDHKRTIFKSKKQRYIEIRFRPNITDSPSPQAIFGNRMLTLHEMIKALDDLALDDEVAGIVIDPDELTVGFSMMMEMRAALLRSKAAGKKIYVFASTLTDGQYALASFADGIYLNTGGVMIIDGIGMGVPFWKGTFDKLGLTAQYYRRGKYKSAVETYTRESMSEPNREARQALLNDIDRYYRQMLLDRSGLTEEKLDTILAQTLFSADQALEYKLIDGLYHPDQVANIISDRTGQQVELVGMRNWRRRWEYAWKNGVQKRIALIYAEGPIMPGKATNSPFSDDKQVGSVTTSKAIRKAREDDTIAGIILRINSPGGSVLASEDIWREVNRTTNPDPDDEKHRKPVFVSMGSVAASGGYYIACAADTIVADSACITGSIGVFAGKLSAGGLMEKIGFNFDVIKTGPHTDMFSLHRSLTDEEGARVQSVVDVWYEKFLARVADGRGMTIEEVDSIGQGRIWSGAAAKELGLVDELGGLEQAITLMKERLGVDTDKMVTLKIYPGYERPDWEDLKLEATAVLVQKLELLDSDLDIGAILDRVVLMNSEPALYLMEELPEVE